MNEVRRRVELKRNALNNISANVDVTTVTKHFNFTDIKVYDKAMDLVYNTTKIGGGDHRLYDGGHTIVGAFNATKHIQDTPVEYMTNTTKALVNDFVTHNGLPLVTTDKETISSISNFTGLSTTRIKSLNSFTVNDIIPMSVVINQSVKLIKKEDITDYLGQNIVITTIVLTESFSIITALGMIVITTGTIIQAVTLKKVKKIGTEILKAGIILFLLATFNPVVAGLLSIGVSYTTNKLVYHK